MFSVFTTFGELYYLNSSTAEVAPVVIVTQPVKSTNVKSTNT